VRIIHMTDVHFFVPPGFRKLLGKRALGMANLYAMGRRHYFDAHEVVGRAVADAQQFSASAFVMTGDLSAMSSQAEFEDARAAFAPLLDSLPSVVIPGNHDVYTRGSRKAARMERTFGPWMAGGTWDQGAGCWVGGADLRPGESVPWPVRFRLGDTDIIATNPCRPSLRASGFFGPAALAAACQLVEESRAAGQQVVFLLHYPPLDGEGQPYRRDGHCIEDVDDLLEAFKAAPPDLILHGHKHHAWRVDFAAGEHTVPILNCGTTSAISSLQDRTAGYYIIEIEGGILRSVRRRVLLAGAETFSDHPSTWEARESAS
jgi:3',5'-cyclic AMP phosphodiesterase CpdA